MLAGGPGKRGAFSTKPDPKLEQPSDAIVQIDTATICGTDLHILKGDVPTCAEGRTLGHEAVGTVVETGDAVENVRQGDRVLISCISACGRCQYCRQGMYGQGQSGGGWILGHLVDGTQAELARIPFADNSLYKVPEGLSDEQVLFLSDILPTGFEVGVLNGNVRARRRRGRRGGGRPRDLRALHRPGPPGRPGRQRRRPRPPGNPPPGAAVDPQPHWTRSWRPTGCSPTRPGPMPSRWC